MKHTVSLQEFAKTGAFGPVKLGMTQSDIRFLFGEPDAEGGTSRKRRRPSIWKYGDYEFTFERRTWTLALIHFEPKCGQQDGTQFTVDPWVFMRDVTYPQLIQGLEQEDLVWKPVKLWDAGC